MHTIWPQCGYSNACPSAVVTYSVGSCRLLWTLRATLATLTTRRAGLMDYCKQLCAQMWVVAHIQWLVYVCCVYIHTYICTVSTYEKGLFTLKKASASKQNVGKITNNWKLVWRQPPFSHAWTSWEGSTSFMYLCTVCMYVCTYTWT